MYGGDDIKSNLRISEESVFTGYLTRRGRLSPWADLRIRRNGLKCGQSAPNCDQGALEIRNNQRGQRSTTLLSFSLSKNLNKRGRCAPPSGRWQTHQWPLLGANCRLHKKRQRIECRETESLWGV